MTDRPGGQGSPLSAAESTTTAALQALRQAKELLANRLGEIDRLNRELVEARRQAEAATRAKLAAPLVVSAGVDHRVDTGLDAHGGDP